MDWTLIITIILIFCLSSGVLWLILTQTTKIVDEESILGNLLLAPFGILAFCMIGLMGFLAIKERWTNDSFFWQLVYGLMGLMYSSLFLFTIYSTCRKILEWLKNK